MMNFLRTGLATLLLACSSAAIGQDAASATTLRFDAAQLQSAAESSFPLQRELLKGFATLSLSQPKVRIPVPGDRVQMDLAYDVKLVTAGTAETGRFTVSSGLRYDPATRGLHLSDPQLQDFQVRSSRAGLDEGTREVINGLMRDYARDRPLYQLSEEELAQLPGPLTADALQVKDGQVELRLAPTATP